MTVVVKFDPSSENFAEELDRATKENTSKEIETIISVLNETVFEDYVVLGRALKSLVDKLDPVDKTETMRHIFINLRPDHRELFDPINIIDMIKPVFGCFWKKRI